MQPPDYLIEETVFKARNIEGRKYSGILQEDQPVEGLKGDTIHWYIFVKGSKTVIFRHYQSQNVPVILVDVEKAISTFQFTN